VDSVRALLQIHSITTTTTTNNNYINTTDAKSGSTALHNACANGHVSTVQLLLSQGARHVTNTSGKNTPLHWAAAGGHDAVVDLLLTHDFEDGDRNDNGDGTAGVDVLAKNEFGRGALTEGFSSKDTKTVGLLLEHGSATEERLIGGEGREVDPDTEGLIVDGVEGGGGVSVNATDPKGVVVGSSGGEDYRLDGDRGTIAVVDAVDGGGSIQSTSTTSEGGITHEFDFLRDGALDLNATQTEEETATQPTPTNTHNESMLEAMTKTTTTTPSKTLLIRELPIQNADDPFGDVAADDTTGLGIWCASLVMARWMAAKSILGRFDGKNVLELGSGCGVPGLTVAKYANEQTKVILTDINPATIRNMEYNIGLNDISDNDGTKTKGGTLWSDRVTAMPIDWGDESTWPEGEKMDYVIGSDLIYQKSIVPLLKQVVGGLLKDDGVFLYACPVDGRDGLKEFIAAMRMSVGGGAGRGDGECSFRCTEEELAPDLYRTNPLSNGDAEDAFLHFYELPVTEYKLYEFRRRR